MERTRCKAWNNVSVIKSSRKCFSSSTSFFFIPILIRMLPIGFPWINRFCSDSSPCQELIGIERVWFITCNETLNPREIILKIGILWKKNTWLGVTLATLIQFGVTFVVIAKHTFQQAPGATLPDSIVQTVNSSRFEQTRQDSRTRIHSTSRARNLSSLLLCREK